MPSRSPLKPVRPSRESRTEYEGLDPPSGHSVVTEPPLQRNSAGTGGPTSPAVKTSSPCLPPRGAGRAVGGIRAGVENSGRRASATNDSTPIPTIRPKIPTIRRNCHASPPCAALQPTVGCSGAPQEPAISSAASCHPVVLGLDPAMASRGSGRAHTSAFETATICVRRPGVAARGLRPYALGRQRGGHLHSSHDATCPRPVERRALRGSQGPARVRDVGHAGRDARRRPYPRAIRVHEFHRQGARRNRKRRSVDGREGGRLIARSRRR